MRWIQCPEGEPAKQRCNGRYTRHPGHIAFHDKALLTVSTGYEATHLSKSLGRVERAENAAISDRLTEETLERLFGAALHAENCAQEHVSTIYRFWQMPMYTFDFRSVPVPIEDLEAERDASLYSFADW